MVTLLTLPRIVSESERSVSSPLRIADLSIPEEVAQSCIVITTF